MIHAIYYLLFAYLLVNAFITGYWTKDAEPWNIKKGFVLAAVTILTVSFFIALPLFIVDKGYAAYHRTVLGETKLPFWVYWYLTADYKNHSPDRVRKVRLAYAKMQEDGRHISWLTRKATEAYLNYHLD